MNVIARLEFELIDYDVAVEHVSHCTTSIPLSKILRWLSENM